MSLPSGERSDWFDAHDVVGIVLTARWTASVPAIPWLTFGASGEYRFANRCTQTLYPESPTQEVTCDYRGYTVGGELTYRWCRTVSTGLTLVTRDDQFTQIQLPGFGTTIDESVRTTHAGAFLTIMVPKQAFWTITVKQVDGISSWSGRNVAIGGSVSILPW